MGDHRANIKIEVEFHGVKDSTDMWINWVEPMPSSVSDFLEKVYEEGMAKWDEKMKDYRAEQRKQEELKELKRLKEKYPSQEEGECDDLPLEAIYSMGNSVSDISICLRLDIHASYDSSLDIQHHYDYQK